MRGRRVRHPARAETLIPLAAWMTSGRYFKIGAFATLLAVLAVPALYPADMRSVAANSTLKCYDSAGNYEPCATEGYASRSQLNGRTIGAYQPPSWTTIALYQQAVLPTMAVDQTAIWPTTAIDEPANWTTGATLRRSGALGKRPASATCGRRLVPCLFSALRRGLTHIASVAVGQVRPAREHL